MKLVEFTRDMRPYVGGETRVVPDDVAARLIEAGDAKPRESIFDQAQPEPPRARRGRYLTRRVT